MPSSSDDSIKKGAWSPDEDALLRQKVKELGPQRWSVISEFLKGRSGKSCRLRYDYPYICQCEHVGVPFGPPRSRQPGALNPDAARRWWNHLNPAVKKATFSDWEDAVILKVGRHL